jgi:hypothetical protein
MRILALFMRILFPRAHKSAHKLRTQGLLRMLDKVTQKELGCLVKDRKPVQKVLRELAGPSYKTVSDEEYVLKFLDLVEAKNLMPQTTIKTTSVRISLEALLIRA